MRKVNYAQAKDRLAFLSQEFGYHADAETVGEIKFLRALIAWGDAQRAEFLEIERKRALYARPQTLPERGTARVKRGGPERA